jgi:hypothetical protein
MTEMVERTYPNYLTAQIHTDGHVYLVAEENTALGDHFMVYPEQLPGLASDLLALAVTLHPDRDWAARVARLIATDPNGDLGAQLAEQAGRALFDQ